MARPSAGKPLVLSRAPSVQRPRDPMGAEPGGRDGPALPVAEDLCARHICLPVHSDMSAAEVDQVTAAVSAAYDCIARV